MSNPTFLDFHFLLYPCGPHSIRSFIYIYIYVNRMKYSYDIPIVLMDVVGEKCHKEPHVCSQKLDEVVMNPIRSS